jgi:hypothetical protein
MFSITPVDAKGYENTIKLSYFNSEWNPENILNNQVDVLRRILYFKLPINTNFYFDNFIPNPENPVLYFDKNGIVSEDNTEKIGMISLVKEETNEYFLEIQNCSIVITIKKTII